MQHIRIKYTKGEELKFIGHLDLIRVFERTVRRRDELNGKFPPGLKILEAKIISPKEDSLMAVVQAVEYTATLSDNKSRLENKIKELLASEKIIVKRKRKEKIKEIDIRPMIIELSLDRGTLRMLVQSNSEGTTKPDEILSVLRIDGARVKRTRQFVKDKGKLISIA